MVLSLRLLQRQGGPVRSLVHVRERACRVARRIHSLGCSAMRSLVACPRQDTSTWPCSVLTSCNEWSVIPHTGVTMALLRVTRVVTRACQLSLRGLR